MQNGSLSDFFENFGGQLEEANFADNFTIEAANVSAPTIGQLAAGVQQIQQPATAAIGYQHISQPTNQGSPHVVALNLQVAQSSGTSAASQQMVYYNGLG